MMEFVEYPLLSETYPSQPDINNTEIFTLLNKKPRRILKAKRLIKKASPSIKNSEDVSSDRVRQTPNPTQESCNPNEALRATLRKTRYTVRPSELLFLNYERLCEIGTKTPVVKKSNVESPKRKILNSTDNLPLKRCTLEGDKQPCITFTPIKTLQCESKRPFKPRAMPNFARIFKVQSENTENIVEYKQRKAERAATLLSGAKPHLSAPKSTSTFARMKKELTFTRENSPNIAKLPKVQKPPLKSAESTKQLEKAIKISAKKVNFNQNNTTKPNNLKRSPRICSIRANVNANLQAKVENNGNNIIKKENLNKFGFRQDNKPSRVKKDDLVKAVLTKTRPDKETASSKRHEIKGVRLNRRFELLMHMRSHNMQ